MTKQKLMLCCILLSASLALTKHDDFDRGKISTLAADVIKAKVAANAYLISVIGAAESVGSGA